MSVIYFLDKCVIFLFEDWPGGVVCGVLLGIPIGLIFGIFKSLKEMKKYDNDKTR